MPVLEIASPLLRRLGLLATFLALSRIGNFIFLPNLDYAAVAADRVSGECSECTAVLKPLSWQQQRPCFASLPTGVAALQPSCAGTA